MDERAVLALKTILAEHGRESAENAKRMEALLGDYLKGECKGEIRLLVLSVQEGVPSAIAETTAGTPTPLLIGRLAKKLQDNGYLEPAVARWAVEAWAEALGLIAAASRTASPPQPSSRVPSAAGFTSQSAPVTSPSGLVKCPLCGKKNDPRETFECSGSCGRVNLCLHHEHKMLIDGCSITFPLCEECRNPIGADLNAAKRGD